jgi:hypothetical protein
VNVQAGTGSRRQKRPRRGDLSGHLDAEGSRRKVDKCGGRKSDKEFVKWLLVYWRSSEWSVGTFFDQWKTSNVNPRKST